MMCYLCGSRKYTEILNKNEVAIWTSMGSNPNDKEMKHKCIIVQCKECGHLYQPVNKKLSSMLKEIYTSENAQASTPTGKGNWGRERAKRLLDKMKVKSFKSVIEIGCADGHILKLLKSMGVKKLVGIDPSIKKTEERNGILYFKAFAHGNFRLSQKYELIFSSAVFEHIKDINSIMRFCRNNLEENGRLFFSVPNAQKDLEHGDPGIFLHQHVHYFTERSLNYLLRKNGLEIRSLEATDDSLNVVARKNSRYVTKLPEPIFYDDYQNKLNKVLVKTEAILKRRRVMVHGVGSGLNNILGWLHKQFNFVLADNDIHKQGRRYFGKIVKSLKDIELSKYDTVLITTFPFFEEISSQYINMGFKGEFENSVA